MLSGMGTYAAFLRAVNLAGTGRVAMADLRALFATLGFPGARTLLQSGNVVFDSEGRKEAAALERLLEEATAKHLRVETDYLVRSAGALRRVLADNPFPDEAKRDPSHLVVMFLKAAPADASVRALQAAIRGREVVRVSGPHAYLYYPDGIGRSKLTPALLGSKLGCGTGRNWNTVTKVAALMG